jgi:LPS sulfotransferase NodH
MNQGARLRGGALIARARRDPAGGGANVANDLAWSRATGPQRAVTYLICTNPRSGSWLLSEGLAATSLAGNPREWFNILEEQQHRARWRMDSPTDLPYPTYLRMARKQSTSSNGVSGIKLHYYQFAELPRRMDAIGGLSGLTADALMRRLFPRARYIWLTRRDKVRQAISFLLAASTDEWWAIEGAAAGPRAEGAAEPEFDPKAIARLERTFTSRDSDWQAFFARIGVTPYVLVYEDLARDYRGTIARVLDWLAVPGAADVNIPPPRLKRQSDGRNEDWLARYAAVKRESGVLGAGVAPDDTGPDDTGSPLQARIREIRETVPDAWRDWIARSKLLQTDDEAIAEVLVGNGYSRSCAAAEVGRAASDPYLRAAARVHQRLRKGGSLLDIQAQLARLDSRAQAVDRRAGLSREEFRDRYYAAGRPVIIVGLTTGWKAMTAWTPEYLKAAAGAQMAEVMTGRDADPDYERHPDRHRTQMRLADYVDLVYSGRATNDYHMVAGNRFLQQPAARPFWADFAAFPEYLRPAAAGRQSFLWFGPAGTVTPLHHDPSNILLAQVRGRKRVRLVPAAQWQHVYNSSGVFSDVDADRPDLARHPRFGQATVIDVVLEPGEVLFVPVGWWHHVRALDVSMTISFTNFIFPNQFTWE